MSVSSLAVTSIRIERQTLSADAAQSLTWAVVFTGRARVQPLSGDQQNKYSRDTEVVDTKAYIAGTPDVRHGDRMTADNETYIIRAVRDIDLLGRFVTVEMERQK